MSDRCDPQERTQGAWSVSRVQQRPEGTEAAGPSTSRPVLDFRLSRRASFCKSASASFPSNHHRRLWNTTASSSYSEAPTLRSVEVPEKAVLQSASVSLGQRIQRIKYAQLPVEACRTHPVNGRSFPLRFCSAFCFFHENQKHR